MQTDRRRPRILICDPIDRQGVELMETFADVDIRPKLSPAELLNIIPAYDGIVVRSATQVTAEVIQHGLMLKVIARAGTGLDNIDVNAAQDAGIQVVNSPDANTLAVAEHTLALILALARRLPRADQRLKQGYWDKATLMGTGLAGKTLGIVGYGRIGREVAIRAKAFGMKILTNQRRTTPELELDDGVRAVDLDELLAQADFVTLHVPLRPDTRDMIGAAQLARMKPTAYLVNTARGGIVDENALLAALDAGQLAGAALDVFTSEPMPDQRLVQHERVIATPHIAASTQDAQTLAAVTIAEKLRDIFEEVEVDTVLPLQVVPLEKVFPHEHVDRKRAERLAKRLANEKYLLNPPIVMQGEKGYMVLDGATRTAAMKIMGFPHAIVQVVKSDSGLQLHTWYHVIRQVEVSHLMEILQALPQVTLQETDPEKVYEELFEYGGLCYLQTVDGKVYIVFPAPNENRLEAMNIFTNTYIEACHVSRTLNRNLISLQHEYPDMAAVVVFPEFTVSQVMQSAQSGRVFPAGITRFVIPGRILRLGAEIEILKSDKSLREKNRWLHDFLVEKQAQGKIRFYEEPVYLLDE